MWNEIRRLANEATKRETRRRGEAKIHTAPLRSQKRMRLRLCRLAEKLSRFSGKTVPPKDITKGLSQTLPPMQTSDLRKIWYKSYKFAEKLSSVIFLLILKHLGHVMHSQSQTKLLGQSSRLSTAFTRLQEVRSGSRWPCSPSILLEFPIQHALGGERNTTRHHDRATSCL